MDTCGKDGTIRSVFAGVNPQGCVVTSFKQPTSDESDHDFLWRYHQRTRQRGMISIFNRSHYEDVLVVRIKKLVEEAVWRERYHIINEWEHALTLSGVTVLKFYLHISRDEQKKRLESHWTTTWPPSKMRSTTRQRPTLPGMSSRPTSSGTATWSWPARSRTRLRRWIRTIRPPRQAWTTWSSQPRLSLVPRAQLSRATGGWWAGAELLYRETALGHQIDPAVMPEVATFLDPVIEGLAVRLSGAVSPTTTRDDRK